MTYIYVGIYDIDDFNAHCTTNTKVNSFKLLQ